MITCVNEKLVTLKDIENLIIDKAIAFIGHHHQFNVSNLRYANYKQGKFILWGYEEDMKERVVCYIYAYDLSITITFESMKETEFHLGQLLS